MRLKVGSIVRIKGTNIKGTVVKPEIFNIGTYHQPYVIRHYIEGKGFVTDTFDSRELIREKE